eukprot:TRINITY_DN16561_c0_g1_i2.p1 TRINITY_DN16561_c0_g1~~TRINITY_DN16561_c0_g1_i2.p1  ORF type:complete len:153 (+),score=10.60 TRINITY_DN16561_c0_g1_i2:96-554(+)
MAITSLRAFLILLPFLINSATADTRVDKLPNTRLRYVYSEELWVFLRHQIQTPISILYENDDNQIELASSAITLKGKYSLAASSTIAISISSNTAPKINRWIHIGVTYSTNPETDKLEGALYINGVQFLASPSVSIDLDSYSKVSQAQAHRA